MRFKKIKFIEIHQWGNYLRNKWRISFANHLSNEEQLEIGMDGFLWHLCSWRKVNCIEGHEAIESFKQQLKSKCTIFYQNIDEAYLIEDAKLLTIEELQYDPNHMYDSDIYIMDWDSKWTFIMTHESGLGPYFIRKD